MWHSQPVRAARGKALIEVDAASVGSTDILAHQGGYLLHPVAGFVSGYDIVGTVLSCPDTRFEPGERVAAIMPRMGGHATHVAIDPKFLVRVPDSISTKRAATLPLDGVTALRALDMTGISAQSVLINGLSGPVGWLAAQLALGRNMRVVGTASARYAEDLSAAGIRVFDYHDADWRQKLADECGPLDAVIDHTGDVALRALVKPSGRIIRIAFNGANGPSKSATFRGFARTVLLSAGRPRERVCSTPLYVQFATAAYRQDLETVMNLVVAGALRPLTHHVYPAERVQEAFIDRSARAKLVLVFRKQ